MEVFIESVANDRVKNWAKLKVKKGRIQQGACIVEGIRLVEELLASGWTVQCLLWDSGTDELPDSLLAQAKARGIQLVEMSPEAFAAVSDTVTPQGVIAIANIPTAVPHYPEAAVLFDGVQDPGNLGTLIRSAFAFGCTEVISATGSADPYSPKVIRATMGSLFRVNTVVQEAVAYIRAWRQHHPDGQVVAADASATVHAHQQNFAGPCLVIIGNEAAGVSAEAASAATVHVRIPMVAGAESLNAAMAGTIMLYETYRARL